MRYMHKSIMMISSSACDGVDKIIPSDPRVNLLNNIKLCESVIPDSSDALISSTI